jgi:methyl-accepting chemotaxis protein
MIQQWSNVGRLQRGKVSTSVGDLFYVAEPILVNGKHHGVLVIIHCADTGPQWLDGAVLLIIQGTLAVFVIAVIIAWLTARHVLSPLTTLTKTAQSITESDMTQRIPVEGTDEMAKLAITFNEMLDRLQETIENQQEFVTYSRRSC